MLADIGNRSVEANLPSVAESAIDSVKSIALKCSDKPIQSWRSAPRVAAYISRIVVPSGRVSVQVKARRKRIRFLRQAVEKDHEESQLALLQYAENGDQKR